MNRLLHLQKLTISGPLSAGTIATPVPAYTEDNYIRGLDKSIPPFKTPNFSMFSGIEPVPEGEGSYDQFMSSNSN